jgi:DNA-entry nuclease
MITGTRPQNVGKNNGKGGMQYTEMKAYNYLKTHRNGQVYYSAEPNYNENESVPRTVTVNIRSDDGSIDQCVIVYNVAPGYAIDYVTGNFTVSLKNKKEVS